MKNLRIESFDLSSTYSKNEVFEVIAEQVGLKTSTEKSIILNSLHQRENLADTALIKGVAIPHIVIDTNKKPQLFIFKLLNPIQDWICLDGTYVDTLISIFCPKNVNGYKKEIIELKKLFITLSNEDIEDKISRTSTSQEIIAILSEERGDSIDRN